MQGKINFITQYYFPARIIWAVSTGLTALAFLAAGFYILGALALVCGALASTTYYGVEINFLSRHYQEYIWVLGLHLGSKVRFENIQYLFIKDFRIKQAFNSMLANKRSTYSYDEYRGYIKFSDHEKVHILSKDDYDSLVKELTELANRFQVGLIDYSFGQRLVLK